MKDETLKPSAVNPQSLFQSLGKDFAASFPSPHLENDFLYLGRRYESEGISFLTHTMSKMGKSIENGLITGSFKLPDGWPILRGTVLPRIFSHIFKCVFEDDGSLLDHENAAHAVLLLRQLFLYWSRYEQDNMELEHKVKEDFLERISRHRNVLPMISHLKNGVKLVDILSEARKLLHGVFDRTKPGCFDLVDFERNPWGRHGPGAVAGGERALDKWNFTKLCQTPEILFKYSELDTRVLKRTTGIPESRVICVPKDYRGPRVICIEPKELQFAQQGLLKLIVARSRDHYLTRRSINFEDVSISRKLCYDLRYATIDLKDASDRISLNLTKWLFPRWFYRLLVRYRTPIVGGTRSGCFATMGSALCFPIQTLVFWSLTQATVNVCGRKYGAALRRTRVFGDDIIVPTRYSPHVCDVLEAVGLKVNTEKSCLMTPARESCGEWVYRNTSVFCIRPRTHKLSSYRDWLGIVEQSLTAEKLYLYNFSQYLKKLAMNFYTPQERWCRNLQRNELRLPFLSGKHHKLDGYDGLYAYHTGNNLSPFSTGRLTTKWRWVGGYSII